MKKNPFAFLMSSRLSPWSRLINSSLIRRMIDVFIVLAGGAGFFDIKQAGVFDYFTLFIFRGLAKLIAKTIEKAAESFWYYLLGAPLLCLHLAGLIPRYFISLIVTIALLPITLLLHLGIYYKFTKPLEEKALMLESHCPIDDTSEKRLGSYLHLKKLDMDYIEGVSMQKQSFSLAPAKLLSLVTQKTGSTTMLSLYFRYDQGLVSWGKWLFNQVLWVVGKYEAQFEIKLDCQKLSQQNKIALGAMLTLNYAGLTTQIEKDKVLPDDEAEAFISMASMPITL